MFSSLRSEVEGLFLQAPSVDLDALGGQLSTLEALIDEQSSIVQVGDAVVCCPGPCPGVTIVAYLVVMAVRDSAW